MIEVDETALICDFAETYHVYDYKRLPPQTAAAFAVGLRADSRIMMRLGGHKATMTELLLAAAVDKLSLLVWSKTKDAQTGKNRPKSIAAELAGESRSNVDSFVSGEDFEMKRQEMIKELKGG